MRQLPASRPVVGTFDLSADPACARLSGFDPYQSDRSRLSGVWRETGAKRFSLSLANGFDHPPAFICAIGVIRGKMNLLNLVPLGSGSSAPSVVSCKPDWSGRILSR